MIKMWVCLLLSAVFLALVDGETTARNTTHEFTEAGLHDSYKYTGIDIHEYGFQKEQARKWLFSQMHDFGWGDETQRGVTALCLSKDKVSDGDSQLELLMNKQLQIQLSLELARNKTKLMSLCDLSLYINALQASCNNPRNFYGFDLVSILRMRVDVSHRHGHFITPLVYLTLCLNNASIHDDLMKLHEVFSKQIHADKTDILALASLASTCIAKLPENRYRQSDTWIKRLLHKTHADLPQNVYELALIVQALNAARVDPSLWDREEAMHYLMRRQESNGSFGDILATYYILPILSDKSLLSLSELCYNREENGMTPTEVLANADKNNIHVSYALYYGNPVVLTHTMHLQVSKEVNFLDIMRLAQEKDTNYRFSLDEMKENPSVYSIGGTPNDAEKGMYWVLYILQDQKYSETDYDALEPYTQNLKHLVPKFGDRFVFWMKPLNSV